MGTFATKELAMAAAEKQLGQLVRGGDLLVLDSDGVVVVVRRIPKTRESPSTASPFRIPGVRDQEPPENHVAQFKREGELADAGINMLQAFGALSGAGVSAALSPYVSGLPEWMAVFLATLSWSLGCAFATYFLRLNQELSGWAAAGVVSASLLLALAIATGIGVGVLEIQPSDMAFSAHPAAKVPLTFLVAALRTYGLVGTIVGAGIGVWIGIRAADYTKSKT